MRILLINDYGTPNGGAELLMFALRDGLRQRGYDARLFSTSAQDGEGNRLSAYDCLGTTSSFRTLLQSYNPWAAKRLKQVLREFQPHIVHIKIFLTQLSPSILSLLQTVPSLYYVSWYRSVCPVWNKILPDGSACHDRYGKACYRNGCLPLHDWLPLMVQMRQWRRQRHVFNRIVANSRATEQRLAEEKITTDAVIECGVPVRSPRAPLTSLPTIVFAGRLVREKGIDVLLKAFAQVVKAVPKARLLIAGEGPERDRLQALIQEIDLVGTVSLLGHLPRDSMEQYFDQAWVQAVPSRWAEPFGMVAAEAMMRGTAVVATGSGGLVDIVQHEHTGFLVPPEDVDQLAKALLLLLKDRALAEKFGQAGRKIALAKFGETTFVDRFVDHYEALLGESTCVDRRKAHVF